MMPRQLSYIDVVNYLISGALIVAVSVLVFPELFSLLESSLTGSVAQGAVGIVLLYVVGFVFMSIGELLCALGSRSDGNDTVIGRYLSFVFSLQFLPGARARQADTDSLIELFREEFKQSFEGSQRLPGIAAWSDAALRAAGTHYMRSGPASVAIERVRVLKTFARTLAVAFLIFGLAAFARTTLVGYGDMRDLLWFAFLLLFLLQTFVADRLHSDQVETQCEQGFAKLIGVASGDSD